MDNDKRAESEEVEDEAIEDVEEPESLTDEQIRKNRTRAALVRAGDDMGIDTTSVVFSDANSEQPTLVVPEHGRGALLTGGVPGHKGGPGRPPTEIRSACREHGYKQIENLGKMVADHKSGAHKMSITEAVRLSDVLNKYGIGTSIAYTIDEQETFKLCVEVAHEEFGVGACEFIDAILARLA